jgi:acyl transferase domain-containing protein/acyl carrier protein/NAD(P)-dependent dehydrogenase (short-subunit alcohol dehydrogenase family)/2-polyprenyl-3-methyl-5-hydroxy-6-metoxy-1,4-benzoquinol methylase
MNIDRKAVEKDIVSLLNEFDVDDVDTFLAESSLICDECFNENLSGQADNNTRGSPSLRDYIVRSLCELISDLTKVDIDEITENNSIESYGLDSLVIATANTKLASLFGAVRQTAFFEFKTIGELASYIEKDHGDEIRTRHSDIIVPINETPVRRADVSFKGYQHNGKEYPQKPGSNEANEGSVLLQPKHSTSDIAIIGLSGKFPGADSVDELWEVIRNGVDCIEEVPNDRWDWRQTFRSYPDEFAKSYTRWGGFLSDVDMFSPEFFNIAPIDVKYIDPQERIFLESAWNTIEDAGYTSSSLADSKVGVFVGAMYSEHQLLSEKGLEGTAVLAGIANRVSFYFDFKGPSIVIETMCSSSLCALHAACNSIKLSECAVAVVGGVNLSLHPAKYKKISHAKFASTDGRCRSFGEGGDGYVPGEGVASMLVKPLDKAIEDHDHIYGVVKGSSINHGGRTNGYTVPNPQSQGELLQDTFRKTKIAPSTIGYIEAHGTGTSLGDVVELRGLELGFSCSTKNKFLWPVGSIKSNIGHLEAAAGIAGIIKVLLQFKHKMLVPSIHSDTLNKNIDWDKSNFQVQRDLRAWEISSNSPCQYRRASISSFGAGGTNAHVLLEEFVEKNGSNVVEDHYLIVFSARSKDSLQAYLRHFADWLEASELQEIGQKKTLQSVSYTLQVGKVQMQERIAFIVSTLSELKNRIVQLNNAYPHTAQGKSNGINYGAAQQCSISGSHVQLALPPTSNREEMFSFSYLNAISVQWAGGVDFGFGDLWRKSSAKKMSLPTYRFKKKRYWLNDQTYSKNDLINTGVEEGDKRAADLPYYSPQWVKLSDLLSANRTGGKSELVGRKKKVLILHSEYTSRLASEVRSHHQFDYVDSIQIESRGTIDRLNLEGLDEVYFMVAIKDRDKQDQLIDIANEEHINYLQENTLSILFSLIKKITRQTSADRRIDLKLITTNNYRVLNEDKVSVISSSLVGFIHCIGNELGYLRCKVLDVPAMDLNSEPNVGLLASKLFELGDREGKIFALRRGEIYENKLLPTSIAPNNHCSLRQNGVYVVVGGASGIGWEFSHYLATHYNADVAVIGRSLPDTNRLSSVNELGKGRIFYYQGDICQKENIRSVIKKIKLDLGSIHGVVHSALVLRDNSIFRMEETDLYAALDPKVKGSLFLCDAIKDESLDFLLFFSSLQSHIFNPGQANYAAGCTFKDAMAYAFSELVGYTVKTINWGFWGGVGAVANDKYRSLMASQGVRSITIDQGMQTIEKFLSSTLPQLSVIDADEGILQRCSVSLDEKITEYSLGTTITSMSILESLNVHEREYEQLISAWNNLPDFEFFAIEWCTLIFKDMGVFENAYDKYTIDEVLENAKILHKYKKFVVSILKMMETRGALKHQDGFWKLNAHAPREFEAQHCLSNLISLSDRHEDLRGVINLLVECLKNLQEILQGVVPATDIIFKRASHQMLQNIYSGNILSDFFNEITAKSVFMAVKEICEGSSDNRIVNILEVGAGTGSTTDKIVEKIAIYGKKINYVFTDVSNSFLQIAKKKYRDLSIDVEFALFDLERCSEQQSLTPGFYDIVVGANVLHATKNIDYTLNNIKSLLSNGGLLVLNELNKSGSFATLTLGLLDGWWRFNDPNCRENGSPLLSQNSWKNQLLNCGFFDFYCFPEYKSDNEILQSVILSRSNGVVRSINKVEQEHASESKHKPDSQPDSQPDLQADSQTPMEENPAETDESSANKEGMISSSIIEIISGALELDQEYIDTNSPYAELGVDSINSVKIIDLINNKLGFQLHSTDLFNYGTVSKLTEYLCSQAVTLKYEESIERSDSDKQENTSSTKRASQLDIAIVGMAGCYPGASSTDEFWHNLKRGVNSIREVPKSRWEVENVFDEKVGQKNKTYCRHGGFLNDVDCFDSRFFKISARDADLMDPQQRLFTQTCWAALEDAGHSSDELAGCKGAVYVGCISGDYGRLVTDAEIGSFVGNSPAILAARISYLLDLKGPSLAIDSACSSSLVAVDMACKSLTSRDCDFALAGGVNVFCTPAFYLMASSASMLSHTGQCHTFDQRADGFVPGEASAVVILKRLEDAEAARDDIYAVIRASGINQDGRTSGITAPSAESQSELLNRIYKQHDIDPQSIGYVEAHGTGTILGDPIEFKALTDTFNGLSASDKHCAIGSVKTNIGHTLTAAGIVGLTKLVLCLKHKTLVPSLNYTAQNKHITELDSPFYVNTQTKHWEKNQYSPRRGAISAFGFSGTNAHIVVEEYAEEYDAQYHESEISEQQLIVLSAKTEESLNDYTDRLSSFLSDKEAESADSHRMKKIQLKDIAYTLLTGRDSMKYRLAIITDSIEDLNRKLNRFEFAQADTRSTRCGYVKNSTAKGSKKTLQQALNGSIEADRSDLLSLAAEYWMEGGDIRESDALLSNDAKKVHISTYPFRKTRHWYNRVEESIETMGGRKRSSNFHITELARPNSERPNSGDVNFEVDVLSEGFLFSDHQFFNQGVLAGAAQLDLLSALVLRNHDGNLLCFSNLTWHRPVRENGFSNRLAICLNEKVNENSANRIFEFSVFDAAAGFRNGDVSSSDLYTKGKLEISKNEYDHLSRSMVVVEDIRKRCTQTISKDKCYQKYRELNIQYGEYFRSIDELCFNEHECLSTLSLPNGYENMPNEGLLVSSILDGALQSVICYSLAEANSPQSAFMPFTIRALRCFGPISKHCYAYVTRSDSNRAYTFDIDILDKQGRVLVSIVEYTLLPVGADKSHKNNSVSMFVYQWHEQKIGEGEPVGSIRQYSSVFAISLPRDNSSEGGRRYEQSMFADACHSLNIQNFTDTSAIKGINDEASLLKSRQPGEEQAPLTLVFNYLDIPADAGLSIDYYRILYRKVFDSVKNITAQFGNRRIGIVVLYSKNNDLVSACISALSGFFNSLSKEKSSLSLKMVDVGLSGRENRYSSTEDLKRIIEEESRCFQSGSHVVRYENGARMLRHIERVDRDGAFVADNVIKQGGVYVIAGGAGEIGKIIAIYLMERYEATAILLGRSRECTDDRLLSCSSGHWQYHCVDISCERELSETISTLVDSHKKISGVINAAGVLNDSDFSNKSYDDFRKVMQAKIDGTINIDRLTQQLDLDFFVMFSGLSSVFGNAGQTDYATANAFLDEFSTLRNEWQKQGLRNGKTIAINWPHWQEGGMALSELTQKSFSKNFGLYSITNEIAHSIFESALSGNHSQCIATYGDESKIMASINSFNGRSNHLLDLDAEKRLHNGLSELLLQDICSIIEGITGVSAVEIGGDDDIADFGFDSVKFTEFAHAVNKKFDIEFLASDFFEFATVNDLIVHLLESHAELFARYYGQLDPAPTPTPTPGSQAATPRQRESQALVDNRRVEEHSMEPIAIVGMSGYLPKSENLEHFWDNLNDDCDFVSEVPRVRWNWTESSGQPRGEAEKNTALRWGAFLESVDRFDGGFFNLSNEEAVAIDPQQRLILQCVWEALEQAGIAQESLSNSATGVYVAIGNSDYAHLAPASAQFSSRFSTTGMANSMAANRISHYFNLHGPSEPVDTACSSALVAVDRAVQYLRGNNADTAIVSAANLMLTPRLHRAFDDAGVLSQDGRHCCFDINANGYVRGEGVASVVLKPITAALRDNHTVLAVIRHSKVGHSGKSASLTAPNPNAQSRLIEQTYREANIDIGTVSYIEAMGTATQIGDCVEISGLQKAYRELRRGCENVNRCAIGSVKSYIGHTETCSGLISMVNVINCFKSNTLLKVKGYSRANNAIDLSNSPFRILEKNERWEHSLSEHGEKTPLRAGVNSFGFGGVNAHIILESFENKKCDEQNVNLGKTPQRVIIFSAKSDAVLRNNLIAMRHYLTDNLDAGTGQRINIADIAYTLQVGRSAMKHREAFVVSCKEEILDAIDTRLESWSSGNNRSVRVMKRIDDRSQIDPSIRESEQLADAWLQGHDIQWKKLYTNESVRLISLPNYQFEKNSYWILQSSIGTVSAKSAIAGTNKQNKSRKVSSDRPLVKAEAVEKTLCRAIQNLLSVHESIDTRLTHIELGLDSVSIAKLVAEINRIYAIDLQLVDLFAYPTVSACSQYVYELINKSERSMPSHSGASTEVQASFRSTDNEAPTTGEQTMVSSRRRCMDIAVVGMAGRYPGADNNDQLWENLLTGAETVTEIPANRWVMDGFYHPKEQPEKSYSKWGGFMSDVDAFDPLFFNISPREAELIDPKHRLFLQTAWHALEDACIRPDKLAGTNTSVFVGCTVEGYGYTTRNLDVNILTGCSSSILPSRLSYFLDLKGTSLAVDTACSSALVATDLACKALLNGETDLSIVGGVGVIISEDFHIVTSQARMLAKDGKSKVFDDAADGFVPGECVSVIILKELSSALDNNDHIYGVIKASKTNQDGRSAGITAPNMSSQEALETSLYTDFDISPETIGYVETHGTGTAIGDPIEFQALTNTYKKFTEKTGYCAIGSIKANIGHPLTPAGMAGMAKVLLMLKYKMMVPSLHFNNPNKKINFIDSPLYVNIETKKWGSNAEHPRRAALSSFGFSGTSVHMVIEEAPETGEAVQVKNTRNLFVLSAKSQESLQRHIRRFNEFINSDSVLQGRVSFFDILYSLQVGRSEMTERLAIVASDPNELSAQLNSALVGDYSGKNLYLGSVVASRTPDVDILEGASGELLIKSLIENGEYEKLACAWVRGYSIKWELLYENIIAKKISLPGYPFEKRSCGILPVAINGIENNVPRPLKQESSLYGVDIPSVIGELSVGTEGIVDADSINDMLDSFSLLNRYSAEVLIWILEELDFFKIDSNERTIAQAKSSLNISPNLYNQYDALIDFLVEGKWLCLVNDTLQTMDATIDYLKTSSKEALLDVLSDRKLNSKVYSAHYSMLIRCLADYSGVLTGKLNPSELIFRRGDSTLFDDVFFGVDMMQSNTLLIFLLNQYIQQRKNMGDQKTINIVELKVRATAFDNVIFNEIPKLGIDIKYKSLCCGNSTTTQDWQQGDDYSPSAGVSFGDFDFTKPTTEQGIEDDSVDVIIVKNVFHTSANITEAVEKIKKALKSNGILIISEVTTTMLFNQLVLGILDGWWSYNDPENRIAGSPMVSLGSWENVLRKTGFFGTKTIEIAGVNNAETPLKVIATESNGVNPLSQPIASPPMMNSSVAVKTQLSVAGDSIINNIGDMRRYVKNAIAEELQVSQQTIVNEAEFSEYGLDSMIATHLVRRFSNDIAPTQINVFFEYSSVDRLAEHLYDKLYTS